MSAYVVVCDKLEIYYVQKKIQQDIDIAVTVPLCNSYQENRSGQYDTVIEMEQIIPEEDKQNPVKIICRKRHRS